MDYKSLEFCLKKFNKLKIDNIGRSLDGRKIYSISAFFSSSRPWVIFQGGMHAREHLSVDLCVYLAHKIEHEFEKYKSVSDFPNICIVPMLNPDGVEISHYGVKAINHIIERNIIAGVLNKSDYKLIKANAGGVDINNNFDAKWKRQVGATCPAVQGYKGKGVFSEPETYALASLTLALKPIFTVSYHTKGEEIYFDFYQRGKRRIRDEKIASLIQRMNGYAIKSCEKISSGGYKDWCIELLKIPAVTIELGSDNVAHPVPQVEIYEIIAKNSGIIDLLCDIVKLCKEKN